MQHEHAVSSSLLYQYQLILKTEFAHLRSAVEASDFEALYEIAHRLKGSTGLFGCTTMSDIATRLLEASEQKSLDGTLALVNQLKTEINNMSVGKS